MLLEAQPIEPRAVVGWRGCHVYLKLEELLRWREIVEPICKRVQGFAIN